LTSPLFLVSWGTQALAVVLIPSSPALVYALVMIGWCSIGTCMAVNKKCSAREKRMQLDFFDTNKNEFARTTH
jgi:hypothetical protein